MAYSMSPEPFIPYGLTIRPEPLMPKDPVRLGRWWLKVLGSLEDPRQLAYVFMVEAVPCNEDGSTPCEDKRSRKFITQAVARLSFQVLGPGKVDIYGRLIQMAERRLEESPECCIRHALIGKWDGSPCILGESSGERTVTASEPVTVSASGPASADSAS